MTEAPASADPLVAESDADLLTRAQASDYLSRFNVRLKVTSLARLWSVGGNGPPCQHIRGKPWYPRGALRAWALRQRTAVRTSRAAGTGAGQGHEP